MEACFATYLVRRRVREIAPTRQLKRYVPRLKGMAPTNRYVAWMTAGYNRYIVVGIVVLLIIVMLIPFESTIVPTWRLRVLDVNGNACPGMRVDSTWQHYSLELEPMAHRDTRLTDSMGYVEFPRRPIAASLARRIINTAFAYMTLIAHGSVGPSGIVWATGIKDVAWLNYERGKPLPDKMRVEKCLVDDGT